MGGIMQQLIMAAWGKPLTGLGLILAGLLLIAFAVYFHYASELFSTRLADGRYMRILRWRPKLHRSLPFEGHLTATYAALRKVGRLKEDNGILASYLFRWIREGVVEVVSHDHHGRPVIAVRLLAPKPQMTAAEERLYLLLEDASKKTGLIEEYALEEWAGPHRLGLVWWQWICAAEGLEYLAQRGMMKETPSRWLWGVFYFEGGDRFTQNGGQRVSEALGFWRYTRKPDREQLILARGLWDSMLEFALFFGTAHHIESALQAADAERYRQHQRSWGNGATARTIEVCYRLAYAAAKGMLVPPVTNWHAYRPEPSVLNPNGRIEPSASIDPAKSE